MNEYVKSGIAASLGAAFIIIGFFVGIALIMVGITALAWLGDALGWQAANA